MRQTNDSRPRLLFLAQTLPFPPDGGVKIRTFHTLRCLARQFQVKALCFYRWKPGTVDPRVGKAVDGLSEFCEVQAFPIPQEHSRTRLAWDHIRSVLFSRVYTIYTYDSPAFRDALAADLSSLDVEIIHLDSLDLSGYLPSLPQVPTVCVHHDAQSHLLRRRAEHVASPLAAQYLRYQAGLMRREERRVCPTVTLNVAVSEDDRKRLEEIAPSARFEVVPNGVDTRFFQPQFEEEAGIVFVGGTSWYPNKDALSYYCSAILPEIRARMPAVRTMWVGRASKEEIRNYSAGGQGLQLTGYVDDVRPFIAAAACYVAPLRIGGGTRIKILDAWAMGKAVVSTSIGCEGLDARHGENILIADTPAEFAERVKQVLEEPRLRQQLGAEARRTVEDRYSWDAIGGAMNEVYLDLIA